MSVERRVRAYLELAAKDAEAAELLLAGSNRYSAYHVQQAVEKITKALRDLIALVREQLLGPAVSR